MKREAAYPAQEDAGARRQIRVAQLLARYERARRQTNMRAATLPCPQCHSNRHYPLPSCDAAVGRVLYYRQLNGLTRCKRFPKIDGLPFGV